MGDRRIREYLPDYEHEKPINRQYLFNVSARLPNLHSTLAVGSL